MKNCEAVLLDAPMPIAWIDERMNFINANNKFLHILNLESSKALEGKAFSDYFESIEILSLVERFIKSNEDSTVYTQNILINRKIHHFRFTLKKISTPSLIIALYAEDHTAFVEQTQELDALKVSTIASSRMAILGEMTSGIAHEINNPLSVIRGLTDQIARSLEDKPDLAEEITKKLSKIKNTTDRIHKIVKGLRSHARSGVGDPFESNLVSDLINDSLALCMDTLKSHEINLILENIEPGIALECRGTEISQVILNLISNAKDAIKNQDEDRWIRIGAKDIGNFIEFSLTDSGNGISPEIREKILQPFFTTKAVGEGTGLGLSITKGIIESHHGIFKIADDTKNTTFIFAIPKGLATHIPTEV